MGDAEVFQKLKEHESITYIPSKSSKIDSQVLNYIKITKNISSNKIDLIYFNRIENGRIIISRKPFVNFDSIVFFTSKRNNLFLYFFFIRACLLGRALHIKQFGIVSNKRTLFGAINNYLDIFIYSELGIWIKRKYTEIFR